MNRPNVLHTFDFQLVIFIDAHHLCLFLREKRRKKGAHTFTAPHGTSMELPDRLKEVKNFHELFYSSNNSQWKTLYTNILHHKIIVTARKFSWVPKINTIKIIN